MLTVAEITRVEQLGEYRLLWRSLHGRTREAGFAQTREWLECYCRRYGHEDQLRTLVVLTAGQPIGILPLVIRPMPTRVGTLRVLTYPVRDRFAFFGPVGPNPTATLYGALQHLALAPRDWDLIDLRNIDERGSDRGRTANALRLAGLSARSRAWAGAAVVDFTTLDAGDQFRLRGVLRQAERALWQQGRWEVVSSGPAVDPVTLWELAEPLLADQGPQEVAFLRDGFLAADCLGLGTLHVLLLDGQPAGCLLAAVSHQTVEPLAAECTTAAADLIQRVLVGRLLFDGVQSGVNRAVFGPRHLSLAEGWEATPAESVRWTHFARFGARAQLLRWGRQRTTAAVGSPSATA